MKPDEVLQAIDILICTVICLRVVCYRRRGASHRPIAAFLAWTVVSASGAVPLLALLGQCPKAELHDVVLHAVLCLALLATRGNVSELFSTSWGDNLIHRTIRRSHHAQG